MNEQELSSVFYEMFYGIPRQGPGSRASTLRALSLVEGLPPAPTVLDIGCGTGGQTLVLAEALPDATITAVDNHAPFIETLRERTRALGVQDRVSPEVGDMAGLQFNPGSFDMIWSEGSIFIMGLEAGLRAWRPLLRNHGIVAVSDAAWLVDDVPEPCRAFWQCYPGIKTVDACRRDITSCGYQIVADFVQPPSDWWDAYYTPIEQRLIKMRNKYVDDAASLAIVENMQAELELHRRFGDVYSYVFYVLRAS